MATTYITDAELQDKVAARLGTSWPELLASAAHCQDIVEEANQDAYQEIRGTLVSRGFSTDVIDTWDRRVEFNRKIAICFALREAALIREVDQDAINRLCNAVEALETVPILVAGVEQTPDDTGDRVGSGDCERDDDVFAADMEL